MKREAVLVPDPVPDELVDGSLAIAFGTCPLLPSGYITPHTPAAARAARRLEYWSRKTHWLGQPARRAWVHFVLLAFHRLELPRVVQLLVLGQLKRHELGPWA